MGVWPQVQILTNQGPVTGIAPLIVSASRATDIPALYSDWFFERLAAGYLLWTNPFNRRSQYVSLERMRAVVFWTKNPAPMMPRLGELARKGIIFYFLVTVNDYEEEGLEPGLPELAERIESFRRLSRQLGKERVIWRFDPLLRTERLTPARLLAKLERVGAMLHPYTEQLIFSFADIERYRRVRGRLRRRRIDWIEFDEPSVTLIAEGLRNLNRTWGLSLRTCAERWDLSNYGISPGRCIDEQLLRRIGAGDDQLRAFLDDLAAGSGSRLKDPGQRPACGCLVSKDIGQYNTCSQDCLYCYANSSEAVVRRNRQGHDWRGAAISAPAAILEEPEC